MPLCHFAFGSLYRTGEINAQVDAFLESILIPKNLMAFKCPEFLPIINNPGAKFAKPDSAVVTEDGGLTFTEWVSSPPVTLIQCDVWMVCFVDVALKKLKRWAPVNHYGKLGISFKDEFRRRHEIKNVEYYQLKGLEKDSLVRRYNQLVELEYENELEKMSKALLGYRKPAALWPEFEKLYAMFQFSAESEGTKISKITYSRYETGYKFYEEYEARWMTEESNRLLPFSENDVLKIITPNEHSAEVIREKLSSEWEKVPEIMVYPSDA